MIIATFNCNSVRARCEAILAWLDAHRPDVLALQETKCDDEHFPAEAFTRAGWCVNFRGEKRYNGVALISRAEPDEIAFGLGDGDDGLSETRLARGRWGAVTVLNTYVPQGRELNSEAFAFKRQWLERVKAYLQTHADPSSQMWAWVGDLNIAPTEADVYDAKRLMPHVCLCPEMTDAYESFLDWGLVDIFRKHLPDPGVYTFWDYRLRRSLERNLGWRIDHVLATPPLAERSVRCWVDTEPRRGERPSDHTFCIAEFDL